MTWDFVEGNQCFLGVIRQCFGGRVGAKGNLQQPSHAQRRRRVAAQAMRRHRTCQSGRVVSTDPPYYDNIGYADLSDFFYVWLRRSLRPVFPDLFATVAVPKAEELVATPYRHGSKDKAEAFFLDGMTQAMHRLARAGASGLSGHDLLRLQAGRERWR
jgi:putative DNA methylase